MDNNIGRKLDGRYELLELVGTGGMADIYRAQDLSENRTVAVKILKNEFYESEDFLRRFRNESKAIALLSHPNIVKIFDVGFMDNIQFIVMEYIDGITLTDYIEQQKILKWRDAVHFTLQILRALQHAHDRGIVHRDIKPSNIMLLEDGTIKVMDFGIARFNRENSKTLSEKTIGSVHYISPEQARGDDTDERSDIYSVGCMMYEMLTGKKPFDGDNPVSIALMHMQSDAKRLTQLNSTIPEGLEEIVLKAMQKDSSKRYQTAGDMIKDLEEFKKNPSIIFEYKYLSGEETTRYFDKVVAAPAVKKSKPVKNEYEDDYEDEDEEETVVRPSPLLPILFAVGSVFIIGAALFVILRVLPEIFNNSQQQYGSEVSDSVAMPNLVGKTLSEAQSEYGDYFLFNPVEEYSDKEAGIIFSQDDSIGRMIKRGATVTVRVSKGVKQVEIQDFTNRSKRQVYEQLNKEGLIPTYTFAEDEEIAADYVIRTDPPAHSMVDIGSSITIVVSLGPPNVQKAVPDFSGMTKETAEVRAPEYGLIPIFIYKGSTKEKDEVIGQSIAPTTMVGTNTTIEIYLSKGVEEDEELEIQLKVPDKVTGKFEFEYYVNGILDAAKTEIRDLSISTAHKITYTVLGRDVTNFAIRVKSVATGNEGLFYEGEIDFNSTEPKLERLSRDDKIFSALDAGTPTTEDPGLPVIDPAPDETTAQTTEGTVENTGEITIE